MLDSVTKKRIDDLRNIFVGKIPDPKSQVEQITTGLIYKFMYDMDVESVEMGGVPIFFVGDYKKYSWENLFDPKLGGHDKVKLYSDAIEKMYTNPSAPPLFREIFKNSFLPFNDPSTLNMFLKEINEFHYSHSEKLGDAFEYLLSFMGSQGDAGQFRTPRHIIDFIVEIVNPQKNETILDPACGTAGFLISSYKHILTQNTDKKLGLKLNSEDKKTLGNNLNGYDISPDMIRISLVNMYLHEFKTPKIYEYDTLSSEDRWNEYYDVILANPPFMTPKGGIQPHSRFGVQAKKAEVLFIDYIMEHLKPNGRAGIVVPEGIIFQTGTPYKKLRKKLVEDCLVGVISLPAGVFKPYSGVKTSILILNKERSRKSDSIFFAKVKNDGFSLGDKKTPIEKNDLPALLEKIKLHNNSSSANSLDVKSKQELLDDGVVSLSFSKEIQRATDGLYPQVKLREYADLRRGTTITEKQVEEGTIPVIAGGQKPAYLHSQSNRLANSITISSSGAYAGFVSFHPYLIFASDCFTVISKEDRLNQKFLFRLLKSRQDDIYKMQTGSGQPHVYARNFDDFEIPLPPIEIQQEIVDELDGYQKIIDGCRQVIENYKPTIDIEPSWEMVEFQKIISANLDSQRVPITKSDRKKGNTPYYGASGIVDYVEGHLFDEDLLLISEDGANLKDRTYPIAFSISGKTWVNNHAHILRFEDMETQKFVEYYFNQISVEPYLTGSAQPKLNQGTLNTIKIPLPSQEDRKAIVSNLEEGHNIVFGNKRLIEIYTQKIQDRISKVWGDT